MNKVILIGNIGAEPEVKRLQDGTPVATARMATTEKGYTTQNGTQVPDRTEWHTLIFWRKQAELIEKYVHKGDKLYVEGKIKSREYEKDGQKHRAFEIEVTNMEFVGRGNGGQSAPAPAQVQQGPQFAPQSAPAPAPNNYQAAAPQTPPAPSYTPPQAGNGWGGNGGADEFPF